MKTLGAEAESGICLKTTVLINGIDGMKQMPEMSIKTISDPKGTTTAPPAARDSAWAQITPQATRAAPLIRCKRPRTFWAEKYRSAIGPMNIGAIIAPHGIAI